jgi:ferrous iron transport protein B
VTILIAPLMSCSARLPVYVIMISAFIPQQSYLGGLVGLQGLVLLAMYCVGAATALPVAWVLNRLLDRREAAPFILELPSYKIPDIRTVLLRVYQSCASFITRAGSIILAAAIVLWALAYYPRIEPAAMGTTAGGAATPSHIVASQQLAGSYIGQAGHFIEPAVRPLGWDWRIGVAAIASFPAREVVISTLGTLFSLGDGVDESSEELRAALSKATWPDGRPLFTAVTALSLMVFFALCAQCLATLAVIKRETGSWLWPAVTFGYMTTLAYVCALLVYQIGTRLAGGGFL